MSGCQPYHGRSWKPGSSAILGNLRHRLMDMPDSELLVDTARMRGLRTQAAAEPCALRAQIAADDFYMQVCKAYSDSDSPFGLVDCDALVSALRDAFMREVTGSDLGRTPQHALLPVIRHFVGSGCAYERELCEILGRMYRSTDGSTVNAAALLEDFASILSVRSQPPSRADGRAAHVVGRVARRQSEVAHHVGGRREDGRRLRRHERHDLLEGPALRRRAVEREPLVVVGRVVGLRAV